MLHAPFKWALSEYEGDDGMYRALGEPIRIPTFKSNHKGGIGAPVMECLWSNFEVEQCLTQERIKKQMPVVDTAKLIETLEKERDEIDAAIRALHRTVARHFPPPPKQAAAPKAATKSAAKADVPKKKGRQYSPAQRKQMSERIKAAWKKRKGEGGEAAMSRKVRAARKKRKEPPADAAMAAKA